MNRPVLPFAISSVPAQQLPFSALDRAAVSATIASLLESFDRADDAATAGLATASAFQPVSARSHVNRARRVPTRSRLLATA